MEMERYASYLSDWLLNLAKNKPDELEPMEIRIDYQPGKREPVYKIPLFDGIEEVAEKLCRPLRVETTPLETDYKKVVMYKGLVFYQYFEVSPLSRRRPNYDVF